MKKSGIHSFTIAGRILNFDPSDIEPPLLPDDKDQFDITSLALDVAGRCNLNCVYCAERATQPKRVSMSGETLQKAIDFLFKCSSRGIPVSVHLGSGEPLMEPLLVRQAGRSVKKLAKKQNRDFALYLTTNATLIDDEVQNWLIKDNWDIKVSLDGQAEIHDRYRVDENGKGTFERIKKVVKNLSQFIPEQLSTTSVITHGTNFYNVFYGIAGMGVKHIELIPVAERIGSSIILDDNDVSNYRDFVYDYAFRLAGGEELPRLNSFAKRVHQVMGYRNSRIPCGAGRNFLGVGPDGDLYPCFRFIGQENYRLGHIETGPEPKKVKWFIQRGGRSYEKRDSCKDCWAAGLCGGPCFAVSELMDYQDSSLLPGYCGMVIAESEAAIWLIDNLRELNPKRLIEFLDMKLAEE